MKREYIFLALFLVLTSLVNAISFTQSLDNNLIIKEYPQPIRFNLTLENVPSGQYNFYTTSDFYLEPSDFFYVDGQKDLFFNFTATPMERVTENEGLYAFSYSLNDRTRDKRYNQRIIFEVVSISKAIRVYSDPVNLNTTTVVLNIENKKESEINNVHMGLKSVLFDIEVKTDLKSLAKEKINIPISNEDLRKIGGGNYIIDVTFFTDNSNVLAQGELYLDEKKDIIYETTQRGLFIRTTNISVLNTGNTYEDARIELKKNIITQLFTSFSEEPTISYRENNDVFFVWNKRLSPQENYAIQSRTANFMPFLIILISVLIFIGIKRFLRTKITVRKSVSEIKTKNNEFALRVRIVLKAKANVKDISLVDKIPGFVKVYKKGMTTPDEIDAATRRFKWDISEMGPGEERHFSYIIYSRVGYVGKFVLPSSICRFRYNDEIVQVKSNSVFYVAEKKEIE